MKHKSRRSLASGLIQELVDLETWFKSCVNGSNDKLPLNPRIIKFVKHKVFSVHKFTPGKDLDYPTAWQECVTSIDNRGRDLKRRQKEREQKKA